MYRCPLYNLLMGSSGTRSSSLFAGPALEHGQPGRPPRASSNLGAPTSYGSFIYIYMFSICIIFSKISSKVIID